MKHVLFFTICFLLSNISFSQSNLLFVEGSGDNEYIIHKVATKENWYSIGRLYNVHPKDLAIYNKTQPTKGLMLNQEIKVPITSSNRYNIDTLLNDAYSLIPIYYRVKKGDGLYVVAMAHNTTMQSIRQLNDLPSDILQTGQIIQVGSIKVKTEESPLAQMKFELPVQRRMNTVPTTNANEVVVSTSPAEINPDPAKTKLKQKPIERVADTDLNPNATVTTSNAPAPIESKKTSTPVVVNTPVEEPKTHEQGYFKSGYKPKGIVEKEMHCSIFNVIAGAKQHRYYALVDGVTPGTIVQVKNTANGKIIFAKVLGKVPEGTSTNKISISNTAAASIGADVDKLIVSVSY